MTLDGPHLGRAKIRPTNIEEAVNSSMYLGAVGGVAFGGVAVPRESLQVRSLTYHPDAIDGQRLEVRLEFPNGQQKKARAAIPDWQLIPIVRFANGDVLACFTLFGQLRDSAQEHTLLSQGAKILNYHSAFENTLLGLRLLQADILILYPDSIELMSENGRPILGAGEPTIDSAANRDRMLRMQTFRDTLSGGPFQSYLICDYQQDVTFSVVDDHLELTGRPYWYCWREKVRGVDRAKVQEDANRYANNKLNSDRRALMAMSQAERHKRFSRLWDEYVSQHLLQPMPIYSQRLSDKIMALDGLNPHVYQSLQCTMQYAAFFRYVKRESPRAWEGFVDPMVAYYSVAI